jgi:hypothetical protein
MLNSEAGVFQMSWRDPEEQPDRVFSLAEANQLIPLLQRHLNSIKSAREGIKLIQQDIKRASQRAEYGGGSVAGPFYLRALEQMSRSLQALQETGVLLKDVETGLCDFPHQCEGRIVYLCWMLGEEEVKWWHEVTTGFQGRQPIDCLG